MATVIKNDQQEKACLEINNMLNEVKALNGAIMTLPGHGVTIQLGRKQTIRLDAAYADKVISVMKAQRAKRIKAIHAKASKFNVGLDEADLSVISDDAIRSVDSSEAAPVGAREIHEDAEPVAAYDASDKNSSGLFEED